MPPLTSAMLNWHSLISRHARQLKTAITKVARAIDAQVAGRSQPQFEAILVRNAPKQPLHPLARIRQTQSRWFSTARANVRHLSTGSGSKYDRSSFPKSRVSSFINRSTGRAPFASTLRPNLTGGTLGRTAGGYTTGSGRIGGARYFSHGPASQAQVVQNVSQAMRAFLIGGNKAQYDGISPKTGEKRFKTVSTLQHQATQTMQTVSKTSPGSWIDFRVNPTITAMTSLGDSLDSASGMNNKQSGHLNTEGLIDLLSVDFSRALKDLAAVLNDLKRLAALGDVPITYQGHSIRVHFPGCDAGTVQALCEELHVQRGVVMQDPAFDSFVGAEIALLFPYAPSFVDSDSASLFERRSVKMNPQVHLDELLAFTEEYSTHSEMSEFEDVVEEACLSSPSGYESVRPIESDDMAAKYSPLEYQGIEGIYRFIEQCDAARR